MPADRREQFGQYVRESAAACGMHRQLQMRMKWDAYYPAEPLSSGQAAKWWNGKRLPDPRNVDMLAPVLGVDREEMRERAGYSNDTPAAARLAAWSQWTRDALDGQDLGAPELARAINADARAIDDWLGARALPRDADLVVVVAKHLNQDPIAALYAAGYTEVAELAKGMRTDRIGTLIKFELDGIEDGDPWLAGLDADAAHGAIPADEYRRLREDYLRRKEESIRLMRRDYEEARQRNAQTPDKPESDNGGHRRAL